LQASNAFLSAGAASPDEFYDLYAMDLEPEGQWARACRRFMGHRLAVASLVILSIVFAAGFLSGHLAPYGYEEVNIKALSEAPSWAHPFGTDQVGRDYFSRTLFGLRTEAEIAIIVGFVGTVIGVIVGAAAGYLGGFTDSVVMRVADLLLTVPPLVTVLVAAAFLHTDTLFKVCVLFGVVLWMPVARVVRRTSLVVREQEYVHAALAMGASDLRIIRRHVLPNVIGAVAVAASVLAASAVILETTLSYLGLSRRDGCGPASTTRAATRVGRTRGTRVRARVTVATGRSPCGLHVIPRALKCSGRTRVCTRSATSSVMEARPASPLRTAVSTRSGSTRATSRASGRRSLPQHCLNSLMTNGSV
jgi:peptide/nickel transport system permease protein